MKNSINMYDPSHTTVYCQLLNTVKSQFATAYWQIFTAYCQTFDALLLKHQRKKHYIYSFFAEMSKVRVVCFCLHPTFPDIGTCTV